MNKLKSVSAAGMLKHQRGVTLLDVLIAILIFVVGMLALAHLQTNISRSSSDANTRTVAANVGEEILEELRAFRLVRTDPDGQLFAFADIDAGYLTQTIDPRYANYTVTGSVKGYDFAADGTSVIETSQAVAGDIYDFKVVDLTISWTGVGSFNVDEDQSLTDSDLATGSISVSGIVPSIPSLSSAKVNSESEEDTGPPVSYNPGQRPDIVPITLGNQKFKESTTPEPVVRHDLLETWFDVVTYSQVQDDQGNNLSTFLRREEFVTISCECALHDAAGSQKDGFPPAIWTGAEYKVAEMTGKQYGTQHSTGQAQSLYCDTCCRDHHESGSGYKFKTNYNGTGNHPHYYRDGDGVLQVTTPFSGNGKPRAENTYIEACRLVRKDGFFRVAQDLGLYENNAFPENYLTADGDITEYSSYVTDVASSELEGGSPPGSAQSRLSYDGRDQSNRSAVTDTPQQLRSRGIYVDEMNTELQTNIDNCFGNGDRSLCEAPYASSVYELYPFFDIQVTHLARWSETQTDNPVDITNMEIPSNRNQSYSRGVASLSGGRVGGATGHSTIEDGNVGLISTVPISTIPASYYDKSDIYLVAGGDPNPPNPSNHPVLEGSLTAQAEAGEDPSDMVLTGSAGISCSKPTNETFSCLMDTNIGSSGTITVSGYWNPTVSLIVCSNNNVAMRYLSHVNGNAEAENKTVFAIDTFASATGLVLKIADGIGQADCNT